MTLSPYQVLRLIPLQKEKIMKKVVGKKVTLKTLDDFYDVYVKNPDIISFSDEYKLDDKILTKALAISACMTADVTDKKMNAMDAIKAINNLKKN
jgi:hypothetical protein